MDSMPPATTTSESPAAIPCDASITALSPEPQTLLMVRAATEGGRAEALQGAEEPAGGEAHGGEDHGFTHRSALPVRGLEAAQVAGRGLEEAVAQVGIGDPGGF